MSASPALSVVIPTFNEAGNVDELVRQLQASLTVAHEIIFVDDSTDETPMVITRVAGERLLSTVHLIHRPPEQRTGGLSGAVVEGIRSARAPWVVVMDGDLQHPPRTVRDLYSWAETTQSDVVVASRYCGGGDAQGLANAARQFVSTASTRLVKALFPRRLRDCTDPMTGFFALRRDAVDLDRLEPRGFKILLEILVRHDMRVSEIPFVFGERLAEKSKASFAQGIRFLKQVLHLWLDQRRNRAVAFGIVGATGIVVNLAAMAAVLAVMPERFLIAAILSTQVAITWNFAWIDRMLRSRSPHRLRRRYWSFLAINNLDLVIRIPLLWALVDITHVDVYLANVAGIVVAFVIRFLLTEKIYQVPVLSPTLDSRKAAA